MSLNMPTTPLRFALLTALLGLVLTVPPSFANISMDQMILDFGPNSTDHRDITIFNHGDETSYVDVQVFQVLQPGTPDEARQKVTNLDELSLLATPAKIILGPGQQKLLRIVNLKARDSVDRIYRIAVTPIPGEFETSGTAIKVMVGYEALVIIRPPQPAAALSWQRNGTKLTVTNSGNSNVLLRKGTQCTSPEACEELPGKRMYANSEWVLELPINSPGQYEIYDGQQASQINFD